MIFTGGMFSQLSLYIESLLLQIGHKSAQQDTLGAKKKGQGLGEEDVFKLLNEMEIRGRVGKQLEI